ncbi:MAG TPA: alkene reductase [Steroidobacter sp.]|uniref:alkene reductase n=1 Tax=Steroidobacter sp. TaxID=1978227 RepID=UPI002ED81107
MTNPLFTPTRLGRIDLKNRVVMSPMTRSRAIGNVPNELMVEYYRQRSNAGLIITEGTSPSPDGLGYARIPGLYNEAQVAGWKAVTDAVHRAGGKIFVQLMHTGRVSHPLNLPEGARVLGPSAIATPGEMWTDQSGQQPFPTPEVMTEADIAHAIEEFATSSRLAIQAGFDGVELHGANGYLIEQFLNLGSNQRTDRWGGSVENRIRFADAVAKASVEAIGPERVGIRLSPDGVFNGSIADAQTDDLYLQLIERLNTLGLLYIHIVDHSSMGAPPVSPELKSRLRAAFEGKYILSGGYDAARAAADLEEQRGDLVAFGRPLISNPNLVEKLQTGAALRAPDTSTFYTPGEKGYTDYPA